MTLYFPAARYMCLHEASFRYEQSRRQERAVDHELYGDDTSTKDISKEDNMSVISSSVLCRNVASQAGNGTKHGITESASIYLILPDFIVSSNVILHECIIVCKSKRLTFNESDDFQTSLNAITISHSYKYKFTIFSNCMLECHSANWKRHPTIAHR